MVKAVSECKTTRPENTLDVNSSPCACVLSCRRLWLAWWCSPWLSWDPRDGSWLTWRATRRRTNGRPSARNADLITSSGCAPRLFNFLYFTASFGTTKPINLCCHCGSIWTISTSTFKQFTNVTPVFKTVKKNSSKMTFIAILSVLVPPLGEPVTVTIKLYWNI